MPPPNGVNYAIFLTNSYGVNGCAVPLDGVGRVAGLEG